MGLDYSIELYFPIENLKDALRATNRYASDDGISTILSFPDGNRLEVPFAHHNQGTQREVTLTDLSKICFGTAFDFPSDQALEDEYPVRYEPRSEKDGQIYRYEPRFEKDGQTYFRVGAIYLTIRTGKAYVEFSFMAATTGMSHLFVKSTSIHDTFRRILTEAGGVLGRIDIERFYEFLPLEAPELRYTPQLKEEPDDLPHVDWTVLASLETLAYQRKQWQLQGDPKGFYDRWVRPFVEINWWYLRRSAEDMQSILLSTVQDDSPSDEVLTLLFEDSHPDYLAAGCWFVGLYKLGKWESAVQQQFREYPTNGSIFALMRLGEAISPSQINWERIDPTEQERMVRTVNELVSLVA